jgi:hypothetical protein
MPSFLIPLLQYGIPAGMAAIDFLKEMISLAENDPNMTQDEFNAKWAEMQTKYVAAGNAWEAAGNSPDAQA